MLMPETTMDKDNLATGRHDYVRRSRQVFPVKPEAITHRVKRTADNQLWLSVDLSDARHSVPDLVRNVWELR